MAAESGRLRLLSAWHAYTTGVAVPVDCTLRRQPARGAGLVLQRTCNSNVERIGPFGVGWTHAYDIHIDEAIPGMVQTGNIGTACPTFNSGMRTASTPRPCTCTTS
jgi:hypothetical protein